MENAQTSKERRENQHIYSAQGESNVNAGGHEFGEYTGLGGEEPWRLC